MYKYFLKVFGRYKVCFIEVYFLLIILEIFVVDIKEFWKMVKILVFLSEIKGKSILCFFWKFVVIIYGIKMFRLLIYSWRFVNIKWYKFMIFGRNIMKEKLIKWFENII